jgi:hypothetical protein
MWNYRRRILLQGLFIEYPHPCPSERDMVYLIGADLPN